MMAYDPGPDLAALDRSGADLDAVEAALRRLDDGSFESCEVCGAPIGRDRLLRDPLVTRCDRHGDVS
jgi:RNA polymerase-binding transcription factor DksA